MALPVRQQLFYWGLASAVFLLLLWALGNVMLPFLVGGAIAYFLDPVADRLERAGFSRIAATALIALVVSLGAIIATLLIVPTLVRQAAQLVETAPAIAARLQGFISVQFPSLMREGSVLNDTLAQLGEAILQLLDLQADSTGRAADHTGRGREASLVKDGHQGSQIGKI